MYDEISHFQQSGSESTVSMASWRLGFSEHYIGSAKKTSCDAHQVSDCNWGLGALAPSCLFFENHRKSTKTVLKTRI